MTERAERKKPAFQVGFARADITPAGSLDMGGYLARQWSAEGTHDPLFVKAISFGCSRRRVLLLAFDLLCLSGKWCRMAKRVIGEKMHIPAAHILLAATHTHSGPVAFFPDSAITQPVAAYEDSLLEKALQAAESALTSAEPSILREGSGVTQTVALNRRDPLQAPDDLLSVVRVETPSGSVSGHLISFSCHPTVMSAENLQYSADLFGSASRHVENKYEGSFCIMFNGAAGDLSTRFARKRQTWSELDRLGKKLARTIVRASNASTPVKAAPISARTEQMKFSFRPVLPPAKAQRKYESAEQQYSAAAVRDDSKGRLRLLRAQVEGASAQLLISRLGGWKSLFGVAEPDLELQVIRVGDLIFCGLSGEFFGRRGLDLSRAARPKRGIVIGYANGYWGYLVPPAESRNGGYEAMMSPLDARDEPHVVRRAKALINEIKRLPAEKAYA